jgi:hypothetical protein
MGLFDNYEPQNFADRGGLLGRLLSLRPDLAQDGEGADQPASIQQAPAQGQSLWPTEAASPNAQSAGLSSSPPQSGPQQVAANDGTPGNNQAQKAQVDAIVRELGLDRDQRRRFHDEITSQGQGYQEIRQIAIDMFGK